MSGRLSSLLMSASTAIAYVQERGAGPEARGDQKECSSSRLVPLAPCLASMQFRDEPS